MNCNSKLWNLDDKIYFLEQKLFENSKIIDELELNLKKLKVLPNSSQKQPRKQWFSEYNINLKKGKFCLFCYLIYQVYLTFFILINF